MKYSFSNDYAEGAHPRILEKLRMSNQEQHIGYGADSYSNRAKERIKQLLENPEATIYFVTGGTQANLTVISGLLRTHEAVISADSGHIYTNEAGAIEAVGHKIIAIPSADGKLYPEEIQKILHAYRRTHQTKPKMVYLSNASELGTLYSKEELTALYQFCKKNDLLLFMDGARIGSALCSAQSDLTFKDIGQLTDVFYIGGTKNGALLGEAIVLNNPRLNDEFDYVVKQKGALLAKGRLLGIQFLELFDSEPLLFFELAKTANERAAYFKSEIKKLNYPFLVETHTNQLFPVLPHVIIEKLQENFDFLIWKKINEEKAAVRLITSWATPQTKIDEFIGYLKSL